MVSPRTVAIFPEPIITVFILYLYSGRNIGPGKV
jgi:hypothetical protein